MANHQKRILFLCAPFFNYYQHIIKELEEIGFLVDYYNDRPSDSQLLKGLIRLFPTFLTSTVDKYFEKLLHTLEGKTYDIILIVNNKVLTESFLDQLHKENPNGYFIFYTWDSIKFYPNTVNILSYFDIAYSFDQHDTKSIHGLNHLPTFYTNVYKEIGHNTNHEKDSDFTYDLLSVGTAHPNRYIIIKKLIPFMASKELNFNSIMFIEPIRFVYNKLFVRDFKQAKLGDFKFKKVSEDEMISLFTHSKAIFDVPYVGQNGLTLRTLEALGAQRKLITYNKSVMEYDFYNENNVLVLNDKNWSMIPDFLKKTYIELDQNIYDKYSIQAWVRKLLSTWTSPE